MENGNSFELFGEVEDMITDKQLVELVEHFKKTKPMVYNGKGCFSRLFVHTDSGLSQMEINKILSKHKGFVLPKSYAELLKYSNGIAFMEFYDCKLDSLEEAFEYTDEDFYNEKYLNIGTFHEDYIYIKCDGSEKNVYFSNEGIDELEPLNMSFTAFMEASLISGFSYFWLWGRDNYDLY